LTARASLPRYSASELAEYLIIPDAAERLSPVGGPGYLILDLSGWTSRLSVRDRSRLAAALPELPCVTIALVREEDKFRTPSPKPSESEQEIRSLAVLCDTQVSDEAALGRLIEGFRATPLAALIFVQLLRGTSNPSIHAGLIAESFAYSTLQAGPEFALWRSSHTRKKKHTTESGPACRMERDRGLLEIYLSRPAKHNAFSSAMRDSLCEALSLAIVDPSIEEVVLKGEGVSFCSGGDLDEFGSSPDPASAHAIRTTRSPAFLISQLGNRIRSEVHGACIGAGAELPAFTKHVAADADAYFELPEVGLGLIPGAGGSVSLPRRIGRQRTAWLGLSRERINAQTALEWGLVDEVRLGSVVRELN